MRYLKDFFMSVVVRNCPSPTGLLHIGTLRTALYNYLFAKQNNGKIIFRSEDTDKERSTKEFEDDILSGLKNMGMIEENTEVVRQSSRTETYRKYLEQLLEKGKAYYCFLTADELNEMREEANKQKRPFKYPGTFRDYPLAKAKERVANGEKAVIRLKIPQAETITFTDLIRGENTVNTKELDDFVIAKNLDTPLYNFVVVIDDHEMGVTHVLRGEDHVPNTPKQILVSQALGWDIPQFAHLPLILNADKSKLSKRKNKVSVDDFLEDGYLPEALLNFLVLLGWNDGTENEIYSLEEMVQAFSLDRVHKGGAVFDMKKLDWINNQYIKNMDIDELSNRAYPFFKNTEQLEEKDYDFFKAAFSLVREKLTKLSEAEEQMELFYKTPVVSKELMIKEKMKVDEQVAQQAVNLSLEALTNLEDWNVDTIKEKLVEVIQSQGWKNGQLLWPIRTTLSGLEASPGPFHIAEVIGKEETIKRLENAQKQF